VVGRLQAGRSTRPGLALNTHRLVEPAVRSEADRWDRL